MKELETIFDHGVTPKELRMLFGFYDWDKESYVKHLIKTGNPEQNAYIGLYRLYLIRKDEKMAQKYIDLIDDTPFKYFTLLNHDFAAD